jgi:two-component system, OmpR family, alkaline phosphatase synthesis response regulator PhoP
MNEHPAPGAAADPRWRPERVLVVDDEHELVRTVSAYLAQAGYEVLAAYDGEAALHVIQRERPDLVVLDLMLPGRDGWAVTRWLRADREFHRLPILMLTARSDDTDKVVGLELGADDYVTKPFNPREVVARVRALLRRSHPDDAPEVLQSGVLLLDVARHEVQVAGVPVALTATEFRLLQTFMQHPGQAFSRGQLIERALGDDFDGYDRTLDSHIRNLRKKIEPDPAEPTFIETVYGLGYRLAVGPERAAQ